MKRGHRKGALLVGALGAAALGAGVLAPAAATGAAPAQRRVPLPQAVPAIPAGARTWGRPRRARCSTSTWSWPVRTPRAWGRRWQPCRPPDRPTTATTSARHSTRPSSGPARPRWRRCPRLLRAEGLTVGTPDPGSNLLPVHGTAAVVSAAFGTPLESVQSPQQRARAIVNTATPQVPASLSGVVTGVVGLNGLFHENAMLVHAHTEPGGAVGSAAGPSPGPAAGTSPAVVAHAGTPQACPAAQVQASGGAYTSTQMSSIFGLDQLFAQGRTGVGQSIAIVEFEQYLQSDFDAFEQCYGLSNPIRNVVVDGPLGGPGAGQGEAALDTELAAVNAPSASLVVYEAPNNNDVAAMDLFNQIASDDGSQVVTTSWGNCEALSVSDIPRENQVFARMAMQGQTVIAASGDAGSEDCYPVDHSTQLAVDDPGSQPDVLSAGGTTMTSPVGHLAGRVERLLQLPGPRQRARLRQLDHRRRRAAATRWSGPANPGQPASGPACHVGVVPRRARHRLPRRSVRRGRGGLFDRPGRVDRLRRHQRRRTHQRGALRRHQPGLLHPARPGGPRALRGRRRQRVRLHRHHERATTTSPTANGGGLPRRTRLRLGQRARHTGRPEPVPRPAGRATGARRWRR